MTGEAIGILAEYIYNKQPGELTEREKENVSAWATLASGLAGGLAGGDTQSVANAAQAGKTTVENNYLSDKDITTFTEKYANAKTEGEREQLLSDLKMLDTEKQKQALATAIPVNEQKAELEKLKVLQASPDCNTQCQQLVAYSISELEPVANNTELHKNNLSKAVLASVIVAFTLDKPSSGKVSQGTAATGKTGSSAIEDIVKGGEQAGKNLAKNEAVLLNDASKQLDEYVNSFADSKYKPATAIGAVDPLTGKIVTTSNGAVPAVVAPELQAYADKLGGLGVKTACGNTLGRCAEFRAANELLLANPRLKLKDIQFTPAIRPRTGEVVPRCENCKNIFGAE
ncbi:VENN motif pre-toxin domain-containing protein [Morganella morganii]|uniref:VENN motif pre-toxin domain-containing protein n=1 Tax=Morganella morganii TaxID=582 RepID=UPI0033160202